MSDLQATLNYLAGTSNLDAQGAANVLANTRQIDLVGVMNTLAGTTGLELNGAIKAYARVIGADSSLDSNAALLDAILNLLYPLTNLYPSLTIFP